MAETRSQMMMTNETMEILESKLREWQRTREDYFAQIREELHGLRLSLRSRNRKEENPEDQALNDEELVESEVATDSIETEHGTVNLVPEAQEENPKAEIREGLVHKAILEEESMPQVQEMEEFPHQSTNGNGENVAHQVFDKMSQHQERLGIKKKKKGLKSWMFKYKKGNKKLHNKGLFIRLHNNLKQQRCPKSWMFKSTTDSKSARNHILHQEKKPSKSPKSWKFKFKSENLRKVEVNSVLDNREAVVGVVERIRQVTSVKQNFSTRQLFVKKFKDKGRLKGKKRRKALKSWRFKFKNSDLRGYNLSRVKLLLKNSLVITGSWRWFMMVKGYEHCHMLEHANMEAERHYSQLSQYIRNRGFEQHVEKLRIFIGVVGEVLFQHSHGLSNRLHRHDLQDLQQFTTFGAVTFPIAHKWKFKGKGREVREELCHISRETIQEGSSHCSLLVAASYFTIQMQFGSESNHVWQRWKARYSQNFDNQIWDPGGKFLYISKEAHQHYRGEFHCLAAPISFF